MTDKPEPVLIPFGGFGDDIDNRVFWAHVEKNRVIAENLRLGNLLMDTAIRALDAEQQLRAAEQWMRKFRKQFPLLRHGHDTTCRKYSHWGDECTCSADDDNAALNALLAELPAPPEGDR